VPAAPLERRRDLELAAAGWLRRHSTTPARATEFIELYRTLGYEVSVDSPASRDFGAACGACARQACDTQVVIYTRRPAGAGPCNPSSLEPIP
jgi:hypothetical protein